MAGGPKKYLHVVWSDDSLTWKQWLTGTPLGQNNNLFSLSKQDKLGTGQDEMKTISEK